MYYYIFHPDVAQLLYVRLDGVHLRKVGDLTFCVNLRICILNNNFLTKIDGLTGCRHLIKLDLHSNQVNILNFYSLRYTL